MLLWPLPRITFRELSSIEEKRPTALLTNDDVWAVVGSQLNLPIVIQAEPERYGHDLFDYLADHLPSQVAAIYAVGQGTPVEAGKYIAAKNNKPLIIIPTALDSDGMLTPTALMEETEGDQSRLVPVETGPANDIIIDWTVIESASPNTRGAGIVDVLSIVTGLLDWRYAAQKGKNPVEQRFSPWAASVAAGLASQAIKSAAAIGQGNHDALVTLLDLMMVTVQLSNQLGHSRAQQGSEHFLARILADQTHTLLPHAELVGPCILFVAALHGQEPTALREALTNAGVRLDQLRTTDVRLVLNDLPTHLENYAFAYTILNDIDPESETVTQTLEAAGLSIEDDTWRFPEGILDMPLDRITPETEAAQQAALLSFDDSGSDSELPADTLPPSLNG